MKVLLFPVGSHGDVHPFTGVAMRLQQRGHQVVLATSGLFAELADRCGIPFHEVGSSEAVSRLTDNPDIWNPRKAGRLIAREVILPGMRLQLDAIRQLVEPGNTVIVGSGLGFGTRLAHEAFHIPLVTLHLQPTMFWSVYQSPRLSRHSLLGNNVPRWLKALQFRIGVWMMFDLNLLRECNSLRAELGLPAIRSSWDMMHSPQRICAMFPEWFGPRQPDWPPQTIFTGFPRWDEQGISEVSPELDQFLSSGDPPIAFTPGSGHTHATSFWNAAIDACQRTGRRGLLLTRHVAQIPKNLPEGVRHFAYAPFSEILPRCAALVYHGGVGTLSQALAAGIPHLIMPMAHDQPDNACRIRSLGVGDFLWPNQFKGRRLASMLERLLSSREVNAACQRYAGLLTSDDGIAKTCDVIEQLQP